MKRNISFILFFVYLIVLTIPISANGAINLDGNIIENPGFEQGIWHGSKNALVDTTISFSGTNSGMVGSSGTSESYLATDFIDVSPAKGYKISLWIKTENLPERGAYVRIQQYNFIGATLGRGTVKWITTGNTHDWTQFETAVDGLSQNTFKIKIYLAVEASSGGRAWFDDVKFLSGEKEKVNDDFGFEGAEWPVKQNGAFDNEHKRSGNRSARFSGTEKEGYYGTAPIAVDTTRTYDLTVWIKTENVSTSDGAFLQIQQLDEKTGNLGMGSRRIATGGTQDWTKYSYVLNTFNEKTAFVRVYVKLAANVTGMAWFDDVSFMPRAFELNTSKDSKLGNIFTSDENTEIKFDLYNPADEQQDIDIAYKIRDYENSVVFQDVKKVEAKSHRITPVSLNLSEAKSFGTYNLDITAKNTNGESISKLIPFSRIVRNNNDVLNENFGIHTRFAKYKAQEYKESMPIIAQTGAGWIRDEIYWNGVEKEKGIYTMSPDFEGYIDTALEHNLNVLVVLNGSSIYGPTPPDTEEGIEAYAKFCGYVARYYKGRVNHFEIWNEYNIKSHNSSPVIYARTLKRAYEEIKKENPDAFIVGACTARIDLNWIKAVFEAGGYPYMDAVSVHPYSYPTPPDVPLLANVQKVHDLIMEYGEDKPVWATEYGYPTHTGNSTERESAWKLARAHVLASTNNVLDKIFWYNFDNVGIDITEQEQNFGLIRTITAKDIAYTAKEPYVSYNVVLSKLKGAEFVEEFTNDNVRVFKFNKANRQLLAVWAKNNMEDISIKTDGQTVLYTDLHGNAEQFTSQNGKINLTATLEPIYLEGDFSNIEFEQSSLSMKNYENIVAIGGTVTMEVRGQGDDKYELAPKIPGGWTITENTPSAQNSGATVKIKVPDDAKHSEYSVVFKVLNEGKLIGMIKSMVEVLPIIDSNVVPSMTQIGNWDEWNVDITLKNISDSLPISGKVTLLGAKTLIEGDTEFPIENLAPQKEMVITVPIARMDSNSQLEFPYVVEAKSGTNSYSFEYGRNIGFLAAVKAGQEVKIDGVIGADEWDNSMRFDLNRYKKLVDDSQGDRDIKASGFAKWDEDNLYIAVEAIDEEHNQNQVGADIWKGDSIQLGLDTKRLDLKRKENLEIGFALGNDGVSRSWCWTTIGGAALGEITGVDVAITRNESTKKTVYELAIPWSEIIMVGEKPGIGDVIGFSILVNDNDNDIRQGYVEYMSGVGSAKSTTLYGDLLFVER